MGKLAREGREGEGEGRRAGGTATGWRKGGMGAMGGCMEELGPLLVHEPPVRDCCDVRAVCRKKEWEEKRGKRKRRKEMKWKKEIKWEIFQTWKFPGRKIKDNLRN
jgi:hypothetical protein